MFGVPEPAATVSTVRYTFCWLPVTSEPQSLSSALDDTPVAWLLLEPLLESMLKAIFSASVPSSKLKLAKSAKTSSVAEPFCGTYIGISLTSTKLAVPERPTVRVSVPDCLG